MGKETSIILRNARTILRSVDLNALHGKTILLTGASGLIGVHMCACIKESGIKPIKLCAVVNSDPLPFVHEVLDGIDAQIFKGDLTDPAFCASLPMADCIIHAAGYGQPIRFLENPLKTLKLNTLTTFALFDKLLPGGSFLFLSTSEVYTGLATPPFDETKIGTTDPSHPRACYIEAKRCGEAIVNVFRAQGLDAKSARLALAYGPGTRLGDKRVISSFIQKGFDGKIVLLDHGQARRAFCYVTDAVEIMWHILLKGTEAVYNVGGVHDRSIAELAQAVGTLMNVPVAFPDIQQGVKGGPVQAWLDMTKATAEFGKQTFVPLEDGLAQTIEWYSALRYTQ